MLGEDFSQSTFGGGARSVRAAVSQGSSRGAASALVYSAVAGVSTWDDNSITSRFSVLDTQMATQSQTLSDIQQMIAGLVRASSTGGATQPPSPSAAGGQQAPAAGG